MLTCLQGLTYIFLVGSLWRYSWALKVAVVGATGGVGQQVCSILKERNAAVTAMGRQVSKLSSYASLEGCKLVGIEDKNPRQLAAEFEGLDAVVISVGTTAFPTKAWDNNNNPKVACYDSVEKILLSIEQARAKPKRVVLVTSIGVERTDRFPFKILNSFGVLDEKKRSEDLLLTLCASLKIEPIVCRPGRLIGEPFTNLDLARLLRLKKAERRGIVLSPDDDLTGDVDRYDVAMSIVQSIRWKQLPRGKQNGLVFAIVNSAEAPPAGDEDWMRLRDKLLR